MYGLVTATARGAWVTGHIGGLVRERREALGMSQVELGRRIGKQQNYVSRIERGEVALPQRATLELLAEALHIPLPEFYRAAGVLDGIEGAAEPPAPYAPGDVRAGYTPEEVAEIVAFVESRPGGRYRDQLAAERARRTRESYERFCLSLFTAWGANAQLAFAAAHNGTA